MYNCEPFYCGDFSTQLIWPDFKTLVTNFKPENIVRSIDLQEGYTCRVNRAPSIEVAPVLNRKEKMREKMVKNAHAGLTEPVYRVAPVINREKVRKVRFEIRTMMDCRGSIQSLLVASHSFLSFRNSSLDMTFPNFRLES